MRVLELRAGGRVALRDGYGCLRLRGTDDQSESWTDATTEGEVWTNKTTETETWTNR